jgi:two-component system, chemotaxis family, sensor kinase CheA
VQDQLTPQARQFLASFIESGREHIEQINEKMLQLEKHGLKDEESMASIARNAHSLKGAAMTMGLDQFAGLCHRMEELMRSVRGGEAPADQSFFDAMLAGADLLAAMLDGLSGEAKGPVDVEQMLEQLNSLLPEEKRSKTEPSVPPAQGTQSESPQRAAGLETVRIPAERLDRFLNIAVELVIARNQMQSLLALLDQLELSQQRENYLLSQLSAESGHHKHLPTKEAENVELLYNDTVNEAMRRESTFFAFNERFRETLNDLGRLVQETQELVMAIRMLPISLLFSRMPKALRDLSRKCGKEINLTLGGEETQIDKRAIDELGDPLVHLLRNAVDHGIETPEERQAASKTATGQIALRALQVDGKVIIEVADDGRGIDLQAIRKRVLERRLATEEEIERMRDEELLDFIFRPGFSMAPMITDLSGRGVGMDVVRKNVERLNGSVEVKSVLGEGTCIRLVMPMTIATARVFLVRCQGRLLAVHLFAVRQLLRVPRETIKTIKGCDAIYWQGEVVPAARLDATLALHGGDEQTTEDNIILLLMQQAEKKIAFQVDDVLGVEEIVIKTLGTHLRRAPNFSGASVLGTGEVALIVDVARLFAAAQSRAGRIHSGLAADEVEHGKTLRILLAEDQITTRLLEKSILEAAGFEVEAVEDGLAALQKVTERPFDLVITDIQMPRMDGLTLTEKLKNDDRFSHLPVMIMTSLENESDRRRGLEAGADAYMLKKSFDQQSLIDAIHRLAGAELGPAR